MKRGSIALFDSGLGGLTVLKSLCEQFPEESFLYLGDIARLPYGNKSPETIRRYGEQIMNYLHSQGVKLIVIACNSASSVFLQDESYKSIPIINVIKPGAEAAAKIKKQKVAVLGTSATIRSHAYEKSIKALNSSIEVKEIACPLFVPLVEEGWREDPVTKEVAKRYLSSVIQEKIDTLILGCTHYPMIKQDICDVFPYPITFIESGEVVGKKVVDFYSQEIISKASGKSEIKLAITDLTDQFERLARELMGEKVNFSLERIAL